MFALLASQELIYRLTPVENAIPAASNVKIRRQLAQLVNLECS